MPVEISIEGADRFKATARALKAYGRGDLRKELYRGINRAAKPLKLNAKQRARTVLPRGGGLAKRVARTSLRTKALAGGRNAGVRIVAQPNAVSDPLSINRGRVVHPTYGHEPFVVQQVTPGWFTKPMEDGAPVVREEMLKVIDTVGKKLFTPMK